MIKRRLSAILLMTSIFAGCSVKKAGAPTAPPTTELKSFSLNQYVGTFEQSSVPFVFFWPTEREGKALDYQQQVDVRTEIVAAKAISDDLEPMVAEVQSRIASQERDFQALKCSTLCDPDDFLCDPSIEDGVDVDSWKVAETPEEEQWIATCQENQDARKAVKKDELKPLLQQQIEASQAVILAIGDKNMRPDFSLFSMTILEDGSVSIKIDFQGRKMSTEASDELSFISNVALDKVNGYLTFELPATTEIKTGVRVDGYYDFSFELNRSGDTVSLGGDFRFHDKFTGDKKFGRISVSGTLKP
ncbi:MAG: hypothetical protein KDD33_01745 [Bdellovibrionales bacterium]|nr:hypothetical protein [Bdellovibrionales bacterium]